MFESQVANQSFQGFEIIANVKCPRCFHGGAHYISRNPKQTNTKYNLQTARNPNISQSAIHHFRLFSQHGYCASTGDAIKKAKITSEALQAQ